MAFGSYSSINDVILQHHIRFRTGTVVTLVSDAPPFSEYFRNELDFTLESFQVNRSEIASGEFVLLPILREVWKTYRPDLSLFSHEPLSYDDDLTGVPDYFVCKRSEFSPFYPTTPYFLVVEAKLDNFEKAWGQCLAAMLAAQKLNGQPELPVFGITTNSKSWEFGILRGWEFTQQPEPLALYSLDTLNQALHSILRQCQAMARAHTPVATP